jgi:hypothetical protein
MRRRFHARSTLAASQATDPDTHRLHLRRVSCLSFIAMRVIADCRWRESVPRRAVIASRGIARDTFRTAIANQRWRDSRDSDSESISSRIFLMMLRKKFSAWGLTCSPPLARGAARVAMSSAREIASTPSRWDVIKTLDPCGFLHCVNKPQVTRKISQATRRDERLDSVGARATSRMSLEAVHFSLAGFGFFQ